MIASPDSIYLSAAAYLEWEAQQPIKYEYLNGEAYAMTGGTLAHNTIALNLAAALKTHLRGKECRVFMSDAKVQADSEVAYFYPDVVVTCDQGDRTAKTIVQHPCLIIEVLSPGTEGYDRGEKFKQYRKIDTLQEYALVNADSISVDVYRLNDAGKWELTPYNLDTDSSDLMRVEFTSVDWQGAIAAIYEEVNLSSSSPE